MFHQSEGSGQERARRGTLQRLRQMEIQGWCWDVLGGSLVEGLGISKFRSKQELGVKSWLQNMSKKKMKLIITHLSEEEGFILRGGFGDKLVINL